MRPEAQRAKILNACDWILVGSNRPDEMFMTQAGKFLGDPLSDLNTMHEAEKVLTPQQSLKYQASLGRAGLIFNATAAQRAEAFLRTIGKWHDDTKEVAP